MKRTAAAIGIATLLLGSHGTAAGNEVLGELDWPNEWVVFLPVDREAPLPEPEVLATVPDVLEIEGRRLEPRRVEVDDTTFDFAPLFGGVRSGNTAYAFLLLEVPQERAVTLGLGADWWLQAWLNGEEILNTLETGNASWPPTISDQTVRVTLEAGRNVLAVRFVSGSGSSVLALGGPEELRNIPTPDYAGVVDPVRGMASLMERHGRKPYDRFWRDDGLMAERVIFQDRDFGTEIWLVDNSPTVDHVLTASVWPAWNPDASRLRMRGRRPDREGEGQLGWLFNADYSRLTKQPGNYSRPIWDPDEKGVFYYHRTRGTDSSVLYRGNYLTGETERIAEWDTFRGERVYGLTRDHDYIFLDTPNGGLWVDYEPEGEPIPELGLYAGRPGGPPWEDGEPTRDGPLFELSNAGRNPTVETERWGPLFRIRVGKLVDPETGEMEPVIAPVSGNREYLRTYLSDRVAFPEGEEWEDVRILTRDTPEEAFELYRYFPVMTHGHESPSPDGTFFARDGHTDVINEFTYETLASFDFRSYHMHWHLHPRFFVSWTRGWNWHSFTRPDHANVIHQAFSDGTFQPVVNSKHRFNGYYAGGDFTMQSPDATKIHYGSSMTGRFRNYVAVMARPRPPRAVRWEAERDAVTLDWEAPAYHREIAGYLVYRSDRSGAGYELLTPEPVDGTSWTDETIEPGRAYHYVLSSVERSGLESGYSQEAARAGVDLPASLDDALVVYAETEHAIRDLDTADRPGLAMGRDVRAASDWYYLYRHPEHDSGRAAMDVAIPAGDRYGLWARVRRAEADAPAKWKITIDDHHPLTVEAKDTQWHWVRVSGDALDLPPGTAHISFATQDAAAELDVICLATDPGFEPEGPRPEHAAAPDPVTGLDAQNLEPRVNHLQWDRSADPGFSHFNVYAAREPFDEPSQAHRIGSPVDPEWIDWGLRARTEYHYAVTVVDRRRNESEPVFAAHRTPARQTPEHAVELTFDDAETEGSFERSEGGGSRAGRFLVPEEPGKNRVTWRIEVPEDDQYYFWLRYLHRGDGSRGGTVDHAVLASLNGETLTTLGGSTDLHAPDDLLEPGDPLAERLWTWAWPGEMNLEGVALPAGEHTLTLENLHEEIRYDVLLLTNEPAFRPDDGRLRQR